MTHPQNNVILACGSQDLADTFSRKISNTLSEYGPQMTGVHLDTRIKRLNNFRTNFCGEFHSRTPGSAIAGIGAHLLVGDDLVTTHQAAASVSQRNTTAAWFNSEFLTRGAPNAKIILVMSRRHPDDLSGRQIALSPDLPKNKQWKRLTLPAINEKNEALWPEHWPLEKLQQVREEYEKAGTSYLWNSLYQQNPTLDSTAIEWPQEWLTDQVLLYENLPPNLRIAGRFLSLDPSKGKSASIGDYSAWMDCSLDTEGTLWIIPLLLRVPTTQVEDQTIAFLKQNKYNGITIETNGFQEVVSDNIALKCKQKNLHCPLFKFTTTENKIVRIRTDLTPLLSQKRIRIKYNQSAKILLGQLREFPTSTHDDGPDAISMCWKLILKLTRPGPSDPTKLRL